MHIYIYAYCIYSACHKVKQWHDMSIVMSPVSSLIPATFGRRKNLQPTCTCHGPYHRDGDGKQLRSTGRDSALKWCCVPRIAKVLWWPDHHIIIIVIIIITTMITSSWLVSTITRLAEGVQMKELPFPPTIPQAASDALLAATVSLLLALFLALACVEDKQLPANEVSQDRSPMRLAEGSTDHGGFGWWFRMIVEGVETCWNHKKVKECSTSCSAWPENGPALESTYPFMRWPMALPLVSVSSTDLFIRKTRLFIALVISKSCHVRSLLGMIIQVCIYIYI